jgi:hypothetical protein
LAKGLFLFSFTSSAIGAFINIDNLATAIGATKSASAMWAGGFATFWANSRIDSGETML